MPIKWAPNPREHARVQARGALYGRSRLRQMRCSPCPHALGAWETESRFRGAADRPAIHRQYLTIRAVLHPELQEEPAGPTNVLRQVIFDHVAARSAGPHVLEGGDPGTAPIERYFDPVVPAVRQRQADGQIDATGPARQVHVLESQTLGQPHVVDDLSGHAGREIQTIRT